MKHVVAPDEEVRKAAPRKGGLRLSARDEEVRGAARLSPRARALLVKALLVKATLDLLFVSALAVATSYTVFPPHFQGSLDFADARSVHGWVVDRSNPARAVEVQLFIDGRFVASALADKPRPDVSDKGFAPDERHGYVFSIDPPLTGEHVARVYAVHASRGGTLRTLRQIGEARKFTVE